MKTAALESRPLYSIGTVARLAGVKPDTLRVWERRYGLGAGRKSASGRRLYNQTELEHLQIVARLVENGFRIGEIAGMERKTLDALVSQEGMPAPEATSEPRHRVLFSGRNLCSWLDRHPGCLSRLDALLLPRSPEELLLDDGLVEQGLDMLVVECAALGSRQIEAIRQLRERLSVTAVGVFYEYSNAQCLGALDDLGVTAATLPLNLAGFTATMKGLLGALDVARGRADAGRFANLHGRIFSEQELAKIADAPGGLACGCNAHLAEIISSLANFETYSSNCSVEGWSHAATHACVHAYTNQARWLMEKALRAVLEDVDAADNQKLIN